jgi:hypothetical protein
MSLKSFAKKMRTDKLYRDNVGNFRESLEDSKKALARTSNFGK